MTFQTWTGTHRFPDSGADAVASIMEQVKPDTVLTFGPDGITNHEGHKSVQPVGDRGLPSACAERCCAVLRGATRTHGATSSCRTLSPLAPFVTALSRRSSTTTNSHLDLELDSELLELKVAAIREHQSQIAGLAAAFGEERWTARDGA